MLLSMIDDDGWVDELTVPGAESTTNTDLASNQPYSPAAVAYQSGSCIIYRISSRGIIIALSCIGNSYATDERPFGSDYVTQSNHSSSPFGTATTSATASIEESASQGNGLTTAAKVVPYEPRESSCNICQTITTFR